MAVPPIAIVTGAAGFIGSHVSESLLADGYHVIGIDNFDPFYDVGIKRRNLACVEAAAGAGSGKFEFHEIDITDDRSIEARLDGGALQVVYHLAAKAGVRPSIADPAGYARANLEGTASLLNMTTRISASQGQMPAFVLASSSSVYGNTDARSFAETMDVSEPISPYAATKRACELLAHAHHALHGLPIACLRFFTVFGPRQRPDLAIAKFINRIAAGQTIQMFGDGSTSRDYTFIDDIVAGVRAAERAIQSHGFRIWNLGGNEPIALQEMIATIGRAVGRDPIVERLPMQPGDVNKTSADLTRSTAELGYMPRTRFEDGVRAQAAWQLALDHAGSSAVT